MTNIRSLHNKNKPYFQIKKSVLQDIPISLEAKGLYSVVMSFEEDHLDTKTLSQILKISESHLFKLLDELLDELEMEVE